MGQGENLYASFGYSQQTSCQHIITAFYNEVKDYDFDKPGFSIRTGHFTQVYFVALTFQNFIIFLINPFYRHVLHVRSHYVHTFLHPFLLTSIRSNCIFNHLTILIPTLTLIYFFPHPCSFTALFRTLSTLFIYFCSPSLLHCEPRY